MPVIIIIMMMMIIIIIIIIMMIIIIIIIVIIDRHSSHLQLVRGRREQLGPDPFTGPRLAEVLDPQLRAQPRMVRQQLLRNPGLPPHNPKGGLHRLVQDPQRPPLPRHGTQVASSSVFFEEPGRPPKTSTVDSAGVGGRHLPSRRE